MEGKKSRKRIIAEVLLVAAGIAVLVYLLQEHAPNVLKLLRSGNAQEIDSYLSQYGNDGKYLLVLLQILETVSIVLPSAPVYICAGIMFGKLAGVLVCYGMNLLLNVIIFLAARKMENSHKKLRLKAHHTSKKSAKFGTVEHMLESAKHLERVVFVMCLLPIVPNGMIPYLSARTEIGLGKFMAALALGSLPAIVAYVCCGDVLVSDSYKIILPVIIVLVFVSLVAFIFRKKLSAWIEPKFKSFLVD